MMDTHISARFFFNDVCFRKKMTKIEKNKEECVLYVKVSELSK